MNSFDENTEKYVRFYLDSLLTPEEKIADKGIYPVNPAKKFVTYVQECSGEDDYLFSYPMSIFWNVTSACNFRCVHCLYNNTEYDSTNDLSESEAESLAEELIDKGLTYAVLTGGEIFTRPDIMNIIHKFKSNNVALRLLTNASLIRDEQIKELAQIFNPYTDSVDISLDGATDKTFKIIRNTDSFKCIIENIKKLTENNIKVTTVCTANKINYSEVPEIYNLSQELGVYSFICGNTVEYNTSHEGLSLTNAELFKLYYDLEKNKTINGTNLSVNFWSVPELLNLDEVIKIINEEHYQNIIQKNYTKNITRNCNFHDKLAIQSDGTMYLCQEAMFNKIAPLGNYKESSFEEIWKNRLNNELFQPRKIEKMVCNECRYQKYCNSGCMVKAYLSSGTINSPQIPSCKM